MRQHRFSEEFRYPTDDVFINRFNTNKWLIDKNNNFLSNLSISLRSTDDMIKANVWHLYKEWIRSDDVSPIFIETEDNLRTFNTNELTRNDNIFILFSSVDDGPVMVVSSQRLHDMLNPTKIPIGIPRISTNPDMRCCLLILLQETLFSSKSHGKYALFPIFTASWRAHRIMNKGV